MNTTSSGPKYQVHSHFPVHFYQWTCPECGDICRDPYTVRFTMCHNGHQVELCVTTDFAYEQMHATLMSDR